MTFNEDRCYLLIDVLSFGSCRVRENSTHGGPPQLQNDGAHGYINGRSSGRYCRKSSHRARSSGIFAHKTFLAIILLQVVRRVVEERCYLRGVVVVSTCPLALRSKLRDFFLVRTVPIFQKRRSKVKIDNRGPETEKTFERFACQLSSAKCLIIRWFEVNLRYHR